MKKFMSFVLTGAVALSAGAYYTTPALQTSLTANAVTTGKYQMLDYSVYNDHVQITGCITLASGEIVIPEKIEDLPVTRVGGFSRCSNVTSVTLPDSVTEISADAFFMCSGLTSINIPDAVNMIGNRAFYGCEGLKSITIPDSVTEVEDTVFYNCSGLESVTISSSATKIGENAFSDCSSLTSVTIPDSVESIENSAFSRCSSLTSVTIPDSVKSIGENAFANCENLKSETISNSLERIQKHAFYKCSSLTSVTVPESVEAIDAVAFYECTSLESITIENPYCDIEDRADTISGTAVIYGHENSTAQFYAEKYGREFRLIEEQPTTEETTTTETETTTTETETTTTETETTTTETETTTTETTKDLKGDANEDGVVTIADSVAILQYLANSDEYPLSEQGLKNADIVGDGNGVNTNDALQIQKWDAGVIDKL